MTDLHVVVAVKLGFVTTLAVDENDRLYGEKLKDVVAEHFVSMLEDTSLQEFIDNIEILSVSTDSDETIVGPA